MKSKRERFETIAARRVQKVLDNLDSISKCSNRNNYEYYEEDIDKMINTIKNKVKSLEDIFEKKFNNKKETFKF